MMNERFPPEPNKAENGGHASAHDPNLTVCQEVEALLPAYSLGATDPEETQFITSHLSLCPIHAPALARCNALAEALLQSGPVVAPPPQLANHLRRAINQPLLRSQPKLATPVQAKTRHWFAGWRWSIMWSAAATTAVFLLIGLNLFWVRQNLQLRQAYETLATTQAQQADDAAEQQQIYTLLEESGRQYLPLPAIQKDSLARAEVLWNPKLPVAVLYVKDFPPLPTDKVYQLWLVHKGQRTSGGLFHVDQDGNGVMIFPIKAPLDQVEIIGITPEPAGGSVTPSGSPIVRRKLS
jgi:anti-sigma-K factor RskA